MRGFVFLRRRVDLTVVPRCPGVLPCYRGSTAGDSILHFVCGLRLSVDIEAFPRRVVAVRLRVGIRLCSVETSASFFCQPLPRRNPAVRVLAAVLQRRVGGPFVAPRTSGRLDISSWRATPRCCRDRTVVLFLGQTTRAEVALRGMRARKARRHPTSSRDPHDVRPSYPRLRRAELSAPASPPAWHELATVRRQRSGGGTVHASSWAGRHGGEAVLEPSIVQAQCELLSVIY